VSALKVSAGSINMMRCKLPEMSRYVQEYTPSKCARLIVIYFRDKCHVFVHRETAARAGIPKGPWKVGM
jgi:hypothetical protein